MFVGRLALKFYNNLRREAAAVKIQKNIRRYQSRKTYTKLKASVLTVQTALRAIASLKEFRFRKQTKASIIIQVIVHCYMIRNIDKGCQYSIFKLLKNCRLSGGATKLLHIIRSSRKVQLSHNADGGVSWPGENLGN